VSATAPILSTSEEETAEAGQRLAPELRAGDVVLLYGELGAGKTAFVRGLARGLGAAPEDVSSPTFTLIQQYTGARATLYHVDLYRLDSDEVEDLGLDELISGDGIVAIEWADRWRRPPSDGYRVRIDPAGEDRRTISIRARNE
jgi:tRNA threonylcarbamoyladenosine biosynthesis protein TsaE